MNDWEVTYGLLVVQITLLSIASGVIYLLAARRNPSTGKQILKITILLVLGLTLVAASSAKNLIMAIDCLVSPVRGSMCSSRLTNPWV